MQWISDIVMWFWNSIVWRISKYLLWSLSNLIVKRDSLFFRGKVKTADDSVFLPRSWSQFMLFSLKCKWGVFRVYLGLLRTERRNLFGIMKFDSSKFMLKAGPFWHRTSSRIMFWRLGLFSNRMFHYKDWYCTLRFFLWWNISGEFHG